VLEGGGKSAVIHLSDGNGDGVMERRTRFAQLGSLVSGFLVRPDGVLIGVRGTILLATDRNHDGRADSLRPFIQHLPVSGSIKIHSNDGMALGPDGRIYFGLGATCNACVEKDPRSATVMSCAASGRDCRVFARGLRNAWDLAFRPADGTLWAGDNGPDPIGGARVDAQDEVDWVRRGRDYGFPFCWGDGRGFDCGKTEPPAVELEPHSAPAGVAFATGDALPAEYRGNLFVTLWGGRRVIRVTIERSGTRDTARASDFVSLDRPVDIVEDTDGSLLVLDADAARIYRIRYAA